MDPLTFDLQLFAEGDEPPQDPPAGKLADIDASGLRTKTVDELVNYVAELRRQNTRYRGERDGARAERDTFKTQAEENKKALEKIDTEKKAEEGRFKELYEKSEADRIKAEEKAAKERQSFSDKRRLDSVVALAREKGIHAPEDVKRYAEEFGFADVKEEGDSVTGAEAVVEKMMAAKPYLFKTAAAATTDPTQPQTQGQQATGALGATGGVSLTKPPVQAGGAGAPMDFGRMTTEEVRAWERAQGYPEMSTFGAGPGNARA